MVSLSFVTTTLSWSLVTLSSSLLSPSIKVMPPLNKRLKLSTSSLSSSSSDSLSSSSTTQRRLTPLRKLLVVDPPTTSDDSTTTDGTAATATAAATTKIQQRTEQMNQRAKNGVAFTKEEIQGVVHSLKNVVHEELDWNELEKLLASDAHTSHKNWNLTEKHAMTLGHILIPNGITPQDHSRQMLERILSDGNWDGAAQHNPSRKPWAVLVTGVNGIRKTTSIYQPWFSKLLKEALIAPASDESGTADDVDDDLPVGSNSFFRQLDHMIATIGNEEFTTLYTLARDMVGGTGEDASASSQQPSAETIQAYSDLKAAIFTRYRTLSEWLGALLLKEAQKLQSNCMLETSGRDVAMFHYVDHFFPKDTYHKLALHFVINDLEYAKTSVDKRMEHEIRAGIAALKQADAFDIINANEGGPYGSDVLAGVQKDSESVWQTEVLSGKVGQDWYKATIQINAHATKPWTAQAVKSDGSLGTEFAFENRK